MSDERRKFKRFDAYMSVKLRSPESKSFSPVNLSNDLSREGMKVSSEKNFKQGTIVDLEISIPDDPKPVYTTGEVVWTKSRESKTGDFDLGIKFLMMDPIDKFRVLDFAYNNWLESKVSDLQEIDSEILPED